MAPCGQASTHSAQNRHRPRSSAMPLPASGVIAAVGHTDTHSRQPSGHFAASTRSAPPWRSGNGGGGPFGYAMVSQPRLRRWAMVSRTNMAGAVAASEIEAAIGQLKTFVADRKIRDGLPTQREGNPDPIVKRRIDDLVAAEAAGGVSERHMAHFSAPALDQRHGERVRPRRGEVVANFALRRGRELLL